MISHIKLFLCTDKQGAPEEGWRIQCLKCVSTYHNKDEDNRPKNHNQNNNFSRIKLILIEKKKIHTVLKRISILGIFLYYTESQKFLWKILDTKF